MKQKTKWTRGSCVESKKNLKKVGEGKIAKNNLDNVLSS